MSACLRQSPACKEEPRPAYQPLLDGEEQPDIPAPRVPHRGEAPLERTLENPRGVTRHEGGGHAIPAGDIEARRVGVEVRVDQSGHEIAAAAIDDGSLP